MTAIVPANPGLPAPRPVDLKAEMLRATRALGQQPPAKAARMMSDLSIDEELVLHSIGWEPVELVNGVSIYSVPYGVWNWGQGEITWASAAYARSFAHATERIHDQCTKAGGQGVVGVHVEVGDRPPPHRRGPGGHGRATGGLEGPLRRPGVRLRPLGP